MNKRRRTAWPDVQERWKFVEKFSQRYWERTLGRTRRDWRNNRKFELGLGLSWIELSQNMSQWPSRVNAVMRFSFSLISGSILTVWATGTYCLQQMAFKEIYRFVNIFGKYVPVTVAFMFLLNLFYTNWQNKYRFRRWMPAFLVVSFNKSRI
jgi:hypothetical protein